MNYEELKEAILSDSHREDYTAHVARFVAEAEAVIRARLTSYALEETLNDVSRASDTTSNLYTLPARCVQVRQVIPSTCQPLDKVDETLIAQYRTLTTPAMYAMRTGAIVIAGTPAEGSTFLLKYYGLPAPLVENEDTNSLLTDYPQLYKELAQVSLFKRAKDFESAQAAFSSANSLINEINRTMRKQLTGARTANPYNVDFRSSY